MAVGRGDRLSGNAIRHERLFFLPSPPKPTAPRSVFSLPDEPKKDPDLWPQIGERSIGVGLNPPLLF